VADKLERRDKTERLGSDWFDCPRCSARHPDNVPDQKSGPNTSLLNWAPASSFSMLLIMVCSEFVKPLEDSVSAGNALKMARYLSIAATLPT
jgi:hypothetical protein